MLADITMKIKKYNLRNDINAMYVRSKTEYFNLISAINTYLQQIEYYTKLKSTLT